MDDILASIRRILDEDQANKEPAADVLMLDPSMMVDEGAAKPGATPAESHALEPPTPAPTQTPAAEKERTDTVTDNMPASAPAEREPPVPLPTTPLAAPAPLVAPEAAAAAASSVGALMRTLASERSSAVSRGGVTIEDIVREEMRPLLKAWLDTHLPSMVERLVRIEIERVVSRLPG